MFRNVKGYSAPRISSLGNFQNKAIGIAIIILLCVLVVVSIILVKTKNNGVYNPTINGCPDYWITSNYAIAESGTCNKSEFGCCPDRMTVKKDADGSNCPVKCYNINNLGKTSAKCLNIPTTMDFTSDTYSGSNGKCNKQNWARKCGITWDGITNVSKASVCRR